MATLSGVIKRGTAANRPAASAVPIGTLYFSSDTLVLERSTGSAWETYSGSATAGILTAAYASRSVAATDGRLFFPTNGQAIERDSGVAWVPWGPVYPLTAPSDTGFAWVNQGSAALVTTRGALEISSAAEGTGDNLHLRVKTAPATPYTITAALRMNLVSRAFQRAGVCWRQSSDGKIITVGMVGIGTDASPGQPAIIEVCKFTNATTFSAVYVSVAWAGGIPLFWRITDSGANRVVSVSDDGLNFVQIHTVGRTDFLTADQVGFFVESTNNDTTPSYDVSMSVISWLQA